MIRRTFWKCPTLDSALTDEQGGTFDARLRETDRYKVTAEDEANLVGSLIEGARDGVGLHAPVLDLDFPARLVPSTTEGHFHLYLDVPMTWRTYHDLLLALGRAGVLEPNYVAASLARRQTFVRKPGVVKPPEAPPSGGWRS
jgi:hypothetical protein